MIRLLYIVWGGWLFCACEVTFAKPVTVYVYHDDAPYLIPDSLDISNVFISQLNERQQTIQFVRQNIKRPQLNSIVESGMPYLILWANPLWFEWRDREVLASKVIFWDADTLVSKVDRAIDFSRPTKLFGLRIGVRAGHFYSNLDKYFKSGKIKRVDSSSSLENYLKLKNNQLDAFVDSRSTISYMQKKLTFTQELYFSINPQDAFSRHILTSRHYKKILPGINKVILEMNNDQSWQATMEDFGLNDLVNPFELDLNELDSI